MLKFVESLIVNFLNLYLSINSYFCFLTDKQDLNLLLFFEVLISLVV